MITIPSISRVTCLLAAGAEKWDLGELLFFILAGFLENLFDHRGRESWTLVACLMLFNEYGKCTAVGTCLSTNENSQTE